MNQFQGLLGLIVIFAVALLFSTNRSAINRRTILLALTFQVVFAFAVLQWSVGRDVLDFVAGQVEGLVGYADAGSEFLFGPLLRDQETIFALQVLPVQGPARRHAGQPVQRRHRRRRRGLTR